MSFSQLISSNYLYNSSILDDNVDPKLLDSNIVYAQNTHIQEILGEALYMSIMNQSAANIYTSVYYQTLLYNWIQPALMYWALYESAPYIQFKFTNKSILKQTSDHSEAIALTDLTYLRNDLRNKAEAYTSRVREYIINNPSQLPEYYQTVNMGAIRPNNTAYDSGWQFSSPSEWTKIPTRYDGGCQGCGADGSSIPVGP